MVEGQKSYDPILKRAFIQSAGILLAVWAAAFITPQFRHPLALALSATVMVFLFAGVRVGLERVMRRRWREKRSRPV